MEALKKCSQKYSVIKFEDIAGLKQSGLTDAEIKELIKNVQEIKKLIEVEITDFKKLAKHSNKIKNAMEAALNSIVYKKNRTTKHFVINFLQELSFSIYTQSKGVKEIAKYANQFFKIRKENYSFEDIAILLDKAVEEETGIVNRNSTKSTLLWAICFPIKALNAALSSIMPLKAKPYDTNNNEIAVCDYGLDGKKARFYYGPNPAVGRIFKAYLDYLRNQGGIIHLHHNLQHLTKRGEDYRIYKLLRIEDKYSEIFRIFSTPMDGEAWDCKDEKFVTFKDPNELLLTYAKFAIANNLDAAGEKIEDIEGSAFRYYEKDKERDNNFYVGKGVMSDSQFKQTFLASQKAMQRIYSHGTNQHWQNLYQTIKGRDF